MAGQTGRESDKFMLRLPEGMRDRIKNAADSNNRSMNAEIVAALEAAFPNSSLSQMTISEIAEFILDAPDAETRKARVTAANKEHERRGEHCRYQLAENPSGKGFRLITTYDFEE